MNNNKINESDRKLYSVLAYIGFLFVVGLLAAKDDEDVKFHVNNGIILFIFEAALGIVLSILGVFFGLLSIIPVIGVLFQILNGLIALGGSVVMLVIAVKGILAAANFRREPLFLIGGFVKNVKIVK